MNPPALESILVVDDVPANLSVLTRALEPEGYELLAASNGAQALEIAAKARPHLILLDIMMPGLDGLEVCRRLKKNPALVDVPVIFITARQELENMVEAFRAGGVDYVVKPFQTGEVLSRVNTHLRLSRLTRELREKNQVLEQRTAELLAEIERRRRVEAELRAADDRLSAFSNLESARGNLSGLIGRSPSMTRIVEEIEKLHQFPHTSVFITGESGTGKELIARAIHFGSARSRAPFVPVNCVAIPADLAESMLFGHVKGSFTGALSDRKGCFEMAHGGTLFLDEIGDMPVALQVKLLRVLEDGCILPVGASQPRRVDVRVLAATNADLEDRMADGRFRSDLYYRLARYTIGTPPLRDRSEDIPLLARHYLDLFSAEMGVPPPVLSPEALATLRRHPFPGNVRELKNVIERALIEGGGDVIQPEHLRLTEMGTKTQSLATANSPHAGLAQALPLNLAEAEEMLIQRALRETGGNIADAARKLGVHRTRIYRKLAQEETKDG